MATRTASSNHERGRSKRTTSAALAPYRGRWVALVGDQVAGVGDSADAARLAARHSRPREAISEVRFVSVAGPAALSVPGAADPHNMLHEVAPRGTLSGDVLAYLREQRLPVQVVGGTVRDMLLGRPTHDLDLAVASGALELARRLANAMGGAYVSLDEGRDVGRAVLRDSQGSQRYVDVAAWRAATLEGDIRLRDFTVNALAWDLPTDRLVDVIGGVEDLHRRLIRTASDRALVDDPLRGLRAVRMLAELRPYGFRLERQTRRALIDAAPSLAACSPERVRDELARILETEEPGPALRTLADLGQLAIVLPEAAALQGVPQSRPHRWRAWEHTVGVVQHVAWQEAWLEGAAPLGGWADKLFDQALAPFRSALAEHLATPLSFGRTRANALRWAALCHDWGKPSTLTVELGENGARRLRFLEHERIGAEMAAQALRRLKFSEAEVRRVAAIVAGHMRPGQLAPDGEQPSRRAVFRYYRDLGDAGVEVALLSIADHRATLGPALSRKRWQWRLALVAKLLTDYFERRESAVAPPPLLDGRELMAALSLNPGRLVGLLLDGIAEAQAVGEVATRAEALDYAAARLPALQEATAAGSTG